MQKANLDVRQGAKYNVKIFITDENDDVIDLSDYTLSGAVKYRYGNSGFYYNLAPTVDNGPSGIIDLTISPAYTVTFPVGEATYEIKRYDGDGNAERTVYGNFNVYPGVTKISESLDFPADEIYTPQDDSDYLSYVAALEAPSSGNLTLSTLQKNSLSTFISGAKEDDFWNYIKALYVLSWNSYGAKAINLKDTSQYKLILTNYGALTSGYLQNSYTSYSTLSGLNLSNTTTINALSFGLGILNNTNDGRDFGNGSVYFSSRYYGGTYFHYGSSNLNDASQATSAGNWDIITYSTGAAFRQNGIVQNSTTSTPVGSLNSEPVLLGNVYGQSFKTTRQYTYFMVGSGFSAERMNDFNSRISTLLSAI
jgi:hypothetical protein